MKACQTKLKYKFENNIFTGDHIKFFEFSTALVLSWNGHFSVHIIVQ